MTLEEKYINELYSLKEFRRLLELKDIINNKYKKEIISFKTNESMYNEAKLKGYLTEDITNSFIRAKTNLYQMEEVKEYFKLESFINKKLKDDFNDIKKSISNKFLTQNEFLKSCK